MLHLSNRFSKFISSSPNPGTRRGPLVTPGHNTYGSYVELLAGASVTDDAYGIIIGINCGAVSAQATDCLVTIGADPAGGTAYSALIEHLTAPGSGEYKSTGGISYFFPLKIRAGTSIAARASLNNATPATFFAVWCTLYCKPSRPELVRAGSFVRSFGATPASSSGTAVAVTEFTGANEGTWVQLGSATAEPLWFWQAGMGLNNATIANNVIHMDLSVGNATNKDEIIANQNVHLDGNYEHVTATYRGEYADVATGALVYGRLLGDTAPSGTSMIAYGVGG